MSYAYPLRNEGSVLLNSAVSSAFWLVSDKIKDFLVNISNQNVDLKRNQCKLYTVNGVSNKNFDDLG